MVEGKQTDLLRKSRKYRVELTPKKTFSKEHEGDLKHV